jgi:hypothetical protein
MDGWMDGWMDGRTDGRTETDVDRETSGLTKDPVITKRGER